MVGTMVIEGSVASDVGCVRAVNEDRVLLVESGGGADRRCWLAIVADGMGGHSAGEVASALAVETVSSEFSWASENSSAALVEAVRRANRRVFELGRENAELTGMGTTCTAVFLVDWHAHFAHVGDSRLYLIRDGDIYRLSEDDSPAMEMVRKGLITREDAKNLGDKT